MQQSTESITTWNYYLGMDENRAKFLSLLFDEGQASCFTESPHGFRVNMGPVPDDLFFCINALHPTKDFAPTKDWHSEYKPRRADANVTCYRNFLIELDNFPLDKQIDYVTKLLPVTTIVYSGGKSYHFIVSLEDPVDAKEYKALAKRLQALVSGADPACKNASRLSRLPSVVRPETGKEQKLMLLNKRINNKELDLLLPILPERPKYRYKDSNYTSSIILEATVYPDEIMEKFNLGGRNAFFFWLYNRMNEDGIEDGDRENYVERAYDNLRDSKGFSLEEAKHAARIK